MAGDETSASVTRLHAGRDTRAALVEIIADLLFLMVLVPLGRYLNHRLTGQTIAWHIVAAGGLAGLAAMTITLYYRIRRRSPDALLEHALPADDMEALAPLRNFAAAEGMDDLAIKLLAPEYTTTENLAACIINKKKPIIILSRFLVDLLSPEELLAVFAHEIAHIRRRRGSGTVPRLVSRGVFLLLTFGFTFVFLRLYKNVPPHDRLFLVVPPLLLACRLMFLLSERLQLWIRRNEEHVSNIMAVDMTGRAGPLISAIEKIAAATGRDKPAPWWQIALFASQPSAASAIARIRRHAARKGIPLD